MSDYPPVLNKHDFVKRYYRPNNAGSEFGNASPSWDTLEEYLASGYKGLVHVRNRIAGGPTWYNIRQQSVAKVWQQAGKPENLYISAMAPTESTTFQGEVMRGLWGLELTYTTVVLPMRDALRQETKYVRGIAAKVIIESFLDPVDYDWLMTLLDRYDNPPHVIEFSNYSVPCGTLNRRLIVWECRSY